MKAAIVERYGPPEVVAIREVPKPAPGDDEVLVRTTMTTVNSGDSRLRGLRVPGGLGWLVRLTKGFNAPRQPILGFEMTGEVEAVGRNVTRFRPGDQVAATHGFEMGLHAEYAVFREDKGIAPIPPALRDEEAVAVLFGGATAQMFFDAAGLKAGDSILINGASGAVGVMAVQLARLRGAEVTAVCSSGNAELARSLGAAHVFAHDCEDFRTSGGSFDVIMDNHGNAPYRQVRHMLRPGGRFLPVIVGGAGDLVSAAWTKDVVQVKVSVAATGPELFTQLLALAADGAIRPVIEKIYPFSQIVEAHRRVDSGRKVGSVVLSLG